MSNLTEPQLRALRSMEATAAKYGADVSVFVPVKTGDALVRRGLAEHVVGGLAGPRYRITDGGRMALRGDPT